MSGIPNYPPSLIAKVWVSSGTFQGRGPKSTVFEFYPKFLGPWIWKNDFLIKKEKYSGFYILGLSFAKSWWKSKIKDDTFPTRPRPRKGPRDVQQGPWIGPYNVSLTPTPTLILSRVTGLLSQILGFEIKLYKKFPGFKFVLSIWGLKCQVVAKIVIVLGFSVREVRDTV